jgi:hypothetical protein
MVNVIFYSLDIAMYYDQTFKAQFGNSVESLNAMRRVVAQAQNIFYWDSLKVKIRLNIVKEVEIKEKVQSDLTNL